MDPVELFCGLLELLNLLSVLFDVVAWRQSQPNRRARQEAKRQHEPPPRRTYWSWLFIALTGWVLFLSVLVLWKWLRPT